MLDKLNREDRLRLMQFVCSFAWADLEIRDEERRFVGELIEQLNLDEDEAKRVRGWLVRPPSPDEVDPNLVPPEHRELFLAAAQAVLAHDGEVNEEEAFTLALFRRLVS